MEAIIFTMLISLVLMAVSAQDTTHIVGGSSGWSSTSDLRGWASRETFYVGDTLVFKYGPAHGVAVVTENNYNNCNTDSPISSHSGGITIIIIDKAGPSYFICPTSGHCQGGMKLSINTRSGLGSIPGSGSDHGSGTDVPTIPVYDPRPPRGGGISPPKGESYPSPRGGNYPSPTDDIYDSPPPPLGGSSSIPTSSAYCNTYGGKFCHMSVVNGKLESGLVLWFPLAATFLIRNMVI